MEIRNSTADMLAEALAEYVDNSGDDRVQLIGEVLGVDGDGTVWVHILGGEERTPVSATNVVVKSGDIVYVVIGDGRADILGNVSRPSTDDTTAIMVDRRVDTVSERVHVIESDYVIAEDIMATNAYIEHLVSEDITASDIVADHAEVESLDANYAKIDFANVANEAIGTALIADAAISDAKILGVSANKLTAGTIDAANINVTNLRADSLIVNKLNGQPVIGGYVAVDSSASGYAEKNPSQQGWYEISNGQMVASSDTEVDDAKAYYSTSTSVQLYDQTYIDGLESTLNSRIDGAIETFSGTVIPTLQNYPYTDWYDTATVPVTDNRAEHVGDLYYVVDGSYYAVSTSISGYSSKNPLEEGWYELSSNEYVPTQDTSVVNGKTYYEPNRADGYCYRFYYDSTSSQYMWVLIKDSDVTAALGRIDDLETFETSTSSWITETDNGLETIRNNHTALSGTVDKTVKESVQLWYTKANATAPSKPSSQVTNNSQTGSNSYNKWNLAVPVYNASYPYYFFCWQFKLVDGTYVWSDVVYDQATSEAEEQGRTGVTLANANIKSSVQLWFSKANTTKPNKPTSQITSDSTSGNAWRLVVPTYSSSYPYYYYCYQQQKGDGTYQWTDVVYDEATSTAMKKAQAALPTSTFETFETTTFKNVKDTVAEHSTTFTTYSEMTATDTSGATVTGLTNIVNSVNSSANSNSTKISSLTQTLGTNADGTTKDGDIVHRTTSVETNLQGVTTRVGTVESSLETVANPNMYPFFSTKLDDLAESRTDTDGYWFILHPSGSSYVPIEDYVTVMKDGWAHFEYDNSSGSALKAPGVLFARDTFGLKRNATYTAMFEVRNLVAPSSSSTGWTLTSASASDTQVKQNASGFYLDYSEDLSEGEAVVYKQFTANNWAADHPWLAAFYVGVGAGAVLNCDVRISVYEGEYSGPYKPYTDQSIINRVYAAETAIEQTANNVLIKATETDTTAAQGGQHLIQSLINVAPSGITIDADKVNIAGAAIFSSGGAYDTSTTVVSSETQWYSSTSATTKSGGTWATTQPSVTAGQYIWQRELVTYADGNTAYKPSSDGVCVQGQTDLSSYSTTTDMNAAIGAANSQEQLIYKSAADGTASMSGTTTWVTDVTGAQATWTTVRPEYDEDYPVLFVATQRQSVTQSSGTTCTCTTPVIDKTTTVIDGGRIITNSITATQINASTLSISAMGDADDYYDKDEANQLAQPNLSPFFEVAYEKGDYWKNGGTFTAGIWTTLSDGWAHFERANTGSSEVSNLLRMAACPSVLQGQQYTCLLEFRNVSVTGNTNTYIYTQQSSAAQFWGNHSYDGWTINNSDIAALAGGKGEFRKLMTARGVSLHESTGTQLIDINQKVAAGQTISYDIRISLYAGEYTGPWKPYSGSQLYASKSELKVQSDRIGMVVSNADASSSLQLTADAMQYIGSHVEITDEAGTSTVISGGKIVADNLHVKSANIDGTLVIGQLPDEAKNSNVQIGGRNLFVGMPVRATFSGSGTTYTVNPDGNGTAFVAAIEQGKTYTATSFHTTSNKFRLVLFDSDPLVTLSQTGEQVENVDNPDYGHSKTFSSGTHSYALLYTATSAVTFDSAARAKLEVGNRPSDWTPAPEDQQSYTDTAVGAANSQEQLIYKSAADGTATMSGTTTWVTDVTGAQATWTAVRPEYSQSYPVLFVATQRKTVGGTVTCTTPAIDKTTTVIDGGSVIANSITASKIQAGSLTIGTFDQSVASSLMSGEAASLAFVPTKYAKTDTAHWYSVPNEYCTILSDGWLRYTREDPGSSVANMYLSPGAWLPVVPGEAYTFLVEIRNFSGPTATNLGYMQQMAGAQFWGNEVVSANGVVSSTYIRYADLVNGAFTKRFVKLADVSSRGGSYEGMCFRYRFYAQKGGDTSFDVRISVYPGVYEGGFSEYPVGVRMSGAEAAIEQNADAIDSASRSLSSQIESLMTATEAIDGRTQAFQLSEADGLTIGSKAEGADMDFNINLKGEGMKFRYKQQVLATASGAGFDAPHLIAGTDLTIGSHWRWQELDGRLVLIYV